MADYTWLDLMEACRDAGFQYGAGLVTAFAVSAAEDSARDLQAVFINNDTWHSRDRGPWQINDHWHAEVTDACAFDLACSTKAAYRISNQGSSFTPWSAYTNARYKAYLDLGSVVYQLSQANRLATALSAQVQSFKNELDDCQAQHAIDVQAITAANQQIATLQAKIDKATAALTA